MTATFALIPAAGRAARFNSDPSSGPSSGSSAAVGNKVFAELAGKPLLRWTADAFAAHKSIDGIVVVAGANEVARCREVLSGLDKLLAIVPGGETRQESVAIGLFTLGGAADDLVLVHDGARPLVSSEVITRCLLGAAEQGNAVAALPVADTLKAVDSSLRVQRTVDREGLWAVQTPQAFRVATLYDAYSAARDSGWTGTDEASLVEKFSDESVHLVPGDPRNFKVTRPEDLQLAEALLRSIPESSMPQTRIGFGYDIHRLVEGRRLMLGGVEIPSRRGLDGHSDADVLLHALCDALLGAAGLPDIGNLFPNTDLAYKDVDSLELLRQVMAHLEAGSYQVGNVDLTLIAEAPKIAPYVPQMRARIAECLNIEPARVGIKATTNEGLGSLGRGEGIAAHAVAAIVAPA
jgi:2-C-methyl-D-erythritol 4-phosphate cytidylyltransferase/2-C-methyl-D-erythritol 2,4-cyclodiphosphate synthase